MSKERWVAEILLDLTQVAELAGLSETRRALESAYITAVEEIDTSATVPVTSSNCKLNSRHARRDCT